MSVELLLGLFGACALLVAGAWGLIKIVVGQFSRLLDIRFEAMEVSRQEKGVQWDRRFSGIEGQQRTLERDLLELKADLPVNYVRREDHIRYETVVNAKLDALATKLDAIAERQTKG